MSLEDYLKKQEEKLKMAAERGKEQASDAWTDTKASAQDMADDSREAFNG